MYIVDTFQSPVQTLPSIDNIVPPNDPPITDGLPRVSPSSHPHVIPRVPTANPLLPPTLLPDRSTAASRLPKRSKDNKDDATAVHNDSPSITISPGKVTKRKYVRKSTQPTPTPPSIDEIQATIQSDNARRKIVQRNILQTQRSLQRFKVSFSSPAVTAMFHLPPIVDSSQFPPHLQPYSTPGVPFNIKYGSKEQFVIETPPDIKLTSNQLKFLQKFVGEILWYATALAHDVLTAISKLSAQQTSPTSDTFPFTIERIQGYFKQYGNHKIQFQASDMKLHIMSDASFDAEPHSKSRGGCFMWLGNNQPTLINGPVFCQSKILPGVPQSAATAEIFQHVESGKMGIYARRILRSIGYPQTPTIIFADNLCSIDFAHNNTKGRTLKTIAHRTHWLKHVVRQNVYVFRYVSSKNNIADIFTKLLDKAQHDYLCNLFLLRDNMLMLTKKKSSNNSNEGVLSNHS